MYCVIGEKVLRCEVKKKEEMSSLCKVGSAKKEQLIANNRLFQTEGEAANFIKKRKANKVNESTLVANAVETCKALYEKLYEETGIEVRTIDRQWTVTSAEKHIVKLKRTLTDKPETHDKSVSKSFSMVPSGKKDNKKFNGKSNDARSTGNAKKDFSRNSTQASSKHTARPNKSFGNKTK